MADAPPRPDGATTPTEPLAPGVASNLKFDVPAGLVVFLVALPLCLGIALASDAPLVAGLVTGVLAGLVVAPLSGSQLAVSGPAAGLTVLVAAGIHDLGSFEKYLVAVMIAGAVQIGAGALRAGVLANFFPNAVIKGMLAAIGIILVLKQLPHALGRDKDFEGDDHFWMLGHQGNTFSEIVAAARSPEPGVVLVTAACLAVLLLWERPFIARQAWTRWLPGPLVAVALGIGINELFQLAAPALYIRADQGHLVSLPSGDLLGALARPDFSAITNPDVWRIGITLAVVASLETLLSLEATDKLDPFKRVSAPNRELMAQGIGNLAAGLCGGLPMTAVIVRSSANIYAGGRTFVAAMVHSALLGGLVFAVPHLLNRIPLAALAAVLLTVGYKLAKVDLFRQVWREGNERFVPFIVTIVATVFTDLLIGVGAGMAVGVLIVLYTNYHSAISVVNEGGSWLVSFSKDVSFLNKTRLRTILAQIPDGAEVVIDAQRAQFVDLDVRDLVREFRDGAPNRNMTVELRRFEGV